MMANLCIDFNYMLRLILKLTVFCIVFFFTIHLFVAKPPVDGENEDRFVFIETVGNGFSIWRDTGTNVLYAKTAKGLTVMLNADGTPVVYEESGDTHD